MKPSERIKEIMIENEKNGWLGNLWIQHIPAIIQYLDEQEAKREGDGK